jgi:hypothetical protein
LGATFAGVGKLEVDDDHNNLATSHSAEGFGFENYRTLMNATSQQLKMKVSRCFAKVLWDDGTTWERECS